MHKYTKPFPSTEIWPRRFQLLLIVVIAIYSSICSTSRAEPLALLPLDIPAIEGVPIVIVGNIPHTTREALNYSNRRSGSWLRIMRLSVNPDIFERLATAYENFGIKKGKSASKSSKYAIDLAKHFVSPDALRKYTKKSASEFEKVRLYRQFVDDYRDAFKALYSETPGTIGIASQVVLGEYNRKAEGFPFGKSGAAPTIWQSKRDRTFQLVDHTSQPLKFLPMPPDQAESLLKELNGRRELLWISRYDVTDTTSPKGDGDVRISLSNEVHLLYKPNDLSAAIFSIDSSEWIAKNAASKVPREPIEGSLR